ncbi:ankyrin repeat domain-containing protein [Chitiniphilus eburneus]|nr:ankyrin repeat domain-containing protein [Chitiniphilus eburneus]
MLFPALVAAGTPLPSFLQAWCAQDSGVRHLPVPATASKSTGDPLLDAILAGGPTNSLAERIQQARSTLDAPRGQSGATPLVAAAMTDNRSAARLLLQAGAKVDAPDRDGVTPLHCSLMSHSLGVTCQLLKAGASLPDARSNPDLLPMVALAGNFDGAAAMIRWLLERGYDIDARTPDDETALIVAAGMGNRTLVALLIAHGADTAIRNAAGYSAADAARLAGHGELAREIQRQQAKRPRQPQRVQ